MIYRLPRRAVHRVRIPPHADDSGTAIFNRGERIEELEDQQEAFVGVNTEERYANRSHTEKGDNQRNAYERT